MRELTIVRQNLILSVNLAGVLSNINKNLMSLLSQRNDTE